MRPESPISFSFPCIRVKQPIGEFFIGSMDCKKLCDISYFDVRRIMQEEREIETYLGIQRPLNKKRVKEIAEYVKTVDASFPTSIILAIPSMCASYDDDMKEMTLSNYLEGSEEEHILYRQIAKVLDGQHRIEGLQDYSGPIFELNISIFVDIDIAEQAYIFSTVNLAQTKVNKSLVYDLFDLAKSRSPQKVCHNIAVALDSHSASPFYQRIKRLGVSTRGRFGETLTQATFVQSLMKYISKEENIDRDIYKRKRTPKKIDDEASKQLIFRNMMIDEKDVEITDIVFNYFDAVRERWPEAWNASGRGIMLNKTNGFKGLMRFLRVAYLSLTDPGGVPMKEEFFEILIKLILMTTFSMSIILNQEQVANLNCIKP
jgi:DGQHR domain-containing protein